MSTSGLSTIPQTLPGWLIHWEKTRQHDVFLRQPEGDKWVTYSWKEVADRARHIAGQLQRMGLQKGDRVAILSQNCAQWIICDLAIVLGGYVSVTLYANVNQRTMVEILSHCEARVLFVGKLVPKDWENIRDSIPPNIAAIAMEGYDRTPLQSWKDFMANSTVPIELPVPQPDDVVTIIYTSGTTGKSKGVVHTHRTISAAIEVVREAALLNRTGNRFFSYLPLSHAAERGVVEGGALASGGTISFVERLDTFASNLLDTRPTHFFGVPRIWEKFREKILEKSPQKRLDLLLKIPLVCTLVKRKIKKNMGLDKADLMLSGAAPISAELMEWFQRIGFMIREGYGMSENFNVCTLTPANGIRIGSVGKPFPGQELRIDPETGEIIQRCDWIMKGYYKDPELTSQTIRNGFLHTGDMGSFSPDGYLTLTGRVKDIFKTSKGEYIVPREIEKLFLEHELVDQACVLGTIYPQPFVITVLSPRGKLRPRPEIVAEFTSILASCNSGAMEYQKLRKVIIVNEEWTVENDLLTPSLKMKRTALSERYEQTLSGLYWTEEIVEWEF